MCTDCINKLNIAYTFRRHCWESNAVLLKEKQNLLLESSRYFGNTSGDNDKTETSVDNYIIEEEKNLIECDVIIKNNLDENSLNKLPETSLTKLGSCGFKNNINLALEQNTKTKKRTKIDRNELKIKKHRNYKCDWLCFQCGKEFKFKSSYHRHMRDHDSEIKSSLKKTTINNYVCEICNKTYIKKDTYRIHMKLHDPENPHRCEICARVFTAALFLDTHRLTHTKIRPFSCETCGKGFINKSELKIHKRFHTGELKLYVLLFEICNFKIKLNHYW